MNARTALIVFLSVCAIAPQAGAGAKLTLHVTPAVAFAPANLVVRASIEADADNRGMAIVAESDGFYRSSEVTLDGDRAPRVTTFEFRSLPPGFYEVKASLLDANGEVRTAVVSEVKIISAGGEPR